ncbi:hypothetical protein SUGI_0098830 [Cryptomeria japonica]|nr:hypothetical protein SUGI_0098830 [Cryptomeria japonica]
MAFVLLQTRPQVLLHFHTLPLNFLSSLIAYTQRHKSGCHSDCESAGTYGTCLQFRNQVKAENQVYNFSLAHHLTAIIPKGSSPLQRLTFFRYCYSTSAIIPHDELIGRLETALETRNADDAWTIFERLHRLRGLPEGLIVNRTINVLTYSGSSKLIKRAYGLVFTVLRERKWHILTRASLIQLCLTVARAQMPLQAAMILRTMGEKRRFPSVSMWNTVIAHMVKSEIGTYLASEVLIELCILVLDAKQRKKRLVMTPDTRAFCVVLNACVGFGSFRKAKEIVALMPLVGVTADATCFIIMAQIYEKTGCKEELEKLKRIIGQDPSMICRQYQQFYSSLLTCHLNFGDLDAASKLVLDMLQSAKQKNSKNHTRVAPEITWIEGDEQCNQSVGQVVSENLPKQFTKKFKYPMVQIEAETLQSDSAIEVPSYEYLVNYEKKILSPSAKIYAMLAKRYLQAGKSAELARFLIRVDQELGITVAENSLCTQVIDACIELGSLDDAHDMMDEMNSAGVQVCVGLYSALLKAYCKARRLKDIAPVLRVVKKAGCLLDPSCLPALVEAHADQKDMNNAENLVGEIREIKNSLSKDTSSRLKTGLTINTILNLKARFLEEVSKNQQVIPRVYELNSAIQFFCKGHLMDDAEKAYRKMIKLGYQPNSQTFEHLISGYSAEDNYSKIAFLWGDMKRMEYDTAGSADNAVKFDKELHDILLYNFLRFGHFERSMELIARMEQQNMFVDKWKYKQVFIKFHRDLSMHRKPSKVQIEEQLRRRKYLVAFKQWAGLI